jgi:membrane-associated phospholipid phosphatase
MNIPSFNNEQKIWVGPVGILLFVILYMLPNHFPLFDSHTLPLLGFEKDLPIMPWTVWFYTSDYLYVALVFTLLSEKENMNRIFKGEMIILFISMIIFFLFPTIYPRPEVNYDSAGITGRFLKLVHTLDSPMNSCPSVHVAITFMGGFGFLREKKYLFPFFMLWAVLISISTITLKQHYLIDVVAGFFFALIVYVGGFYGCKCMQRRNS